MTQNSFEELLKEWNYDKNTISPSGIKPNSNKKVWWRCRKCGFEWEATVANRYAHGSGCRRCNYKKAAASRNARKLKTKGSLADEHPELLLEWLYDKNNNIVSPTEVSSGSQKKVWWKCQVCGYEWLSEINHRTHGSRCRKCSYAERQKPNRKPKQA